MASNKLTNYQLNIIVDKIFEELRKAVDETNAKILESFDIDSNEQASRIKKLIKTVIEINALREKLGMEQSQLKSELREFGISTYIFKDEEELLTYIKGKFIKDSLIYINKRDIELEVIMNQNSDVSTLISNIVQKFKEKLTN